MEELNRLFAQLQEKNRLLEQYQDKTELNRLLVDFKEWNVNNDDFVFEGYVAQFKIEVNMPQ